MHVDFKCLIRGLELNLSFVNTNNVLSGQNLNLIEKVHKIEHWMKLNSAVDFKYRDVFNDYNVVDRSMSKVIEFVNLTLE